ncbi:MAG: hypothetical protein OEN48_16845 [Betaproteobacteria bacterium]|nr:hypothetical protein [Betaproteobacteria bacterium]
MAPRTGKLELRPPDVIRSMRDLPAREKSFCLTRFCGYAGLAISALTAVRGLARLPDFP